MRFLVSAKIIDSPLVPVKTMTAEKEFEFPEKSNVFGRVYEVRQYFMKTYKTKNIEIIKAKEV